MLVIKNDIDTDGAYDAPCAVSFESEANARAWIEKDLNEIRAELDDDSVPYTTEENRSRMFGNGKTEWEIRIPGGRRDVDKIITWTMLEPVPYQAENN